ncbi:hypothetical protein [Coleofasciculus sp. G2-EDA-02]|uniref:hypothetical protein n=1 Tax=Coleofasciculus sp. G2-EDA-02 TaxID=3069529 RepID=UPI0032FDAD4B
MVTSSHRRLSQMNDLLDIGALPGDEWGFTGIFCAHGEFEFGEFTQTKGTATGKAFYGINNAPV